MCCKNAQKEQCVAGNIEARITHCSYRSLTVILFSCQESCILLEKRTIKVVVVA